MKRHSRILAVLAMFAVACIACVTVVVPASVEYPATDASADATTPLRLSASMPRATSFNYTSGTGAATITVPPGAWVSGVVLCSSAGDAGLASIGVAGPLVDGAVQDGAVQGPTITVPAGGACMPLPSLAGGLGSLGPGSTLVVSAASWLVTYQGFASF